MAVAGKADCMPTMGSAGANTVAASGFNSRAESASVERLAFERFDSSLPGVVDFREGGHVAFEPQPQRAVNHQWNHDQQSAHGEHPAERERMPPRHAARVEQENGPGHQD